MTNQLKLVGVGLLGALGLTFIILGCVVSESWWTLLLFIFYAITPLPLIFAQKDEYENLGGGSSKLRDVGLFLVAGLVVSTFAFPIFLSRVPVDMPTISFSNAFLAEFATLIFYTTAGLFLIESSEDEY